MSQTKKHREPMLVIVSRHDTAIGRRTATFRAMLLWWSERRTAAQRNGTGGHGGRWGDRRGFRVPREPDGGSNCSGRCYRDNDADRFGGNPRAGCRTRRRRSRYVGLRNCDGCLPPARGRIHPNLVVSCSLVGLQAGHSGPACAIGGDGSALRAARKSSSRPVIGKQEYHRRSRYWPVILVLHFDNRLPGGALLDVVDGAVAFHNHDVQSRRLRILLRVYQRGQYQKYRESRYRAKPHSAVHPHKGLLMI